ncbi:hypothetical protein GPECTOR_16g708 [Gonium pectorale]|uniref:Uncharacterized protein n=1 Tax=Gonium pectorale TaxID=33097 RepID=A0A150GL37_GONPE|nr:hypothetical protein GPECTOR_16g708 [Gonium pectorale]|eukprot:KXZ50533.1 hypothetical protein GPECTOR_16g708 [Gonium pectorale]
MGEAVMACVIVSSLGNLSYKLVGSGQQRAAQGLALEAAARLARLEALTTQHATEFAAASRQIDKLQVRARVTGVDLRRPITQLQASSAEQAGLLARMATELEALRGQVRDTQALLAALQGLSAKQFQVTVDAIKQLRARQAGG